jgi:copper chaperone
MGRPISINDGEGGRTVAKISITNMTCGGCTKGVLATLRAAAPEAVSTVDLGKREVEVTADDVVSLIAALRADGWEAVQSAN